MSGRQSKASIDATRALFAAAHTLDLANMARALKDGARVRAVDDQNRRPLGVMLDRWRQRRRPPDPAPFIHLFAQHGANLDRPGGKGTPHTIEWLSLTDKDVALFDALEKAGMELGGVDEGDLLRRVVFNRAPRLLESILYSGYDVDPEACDDDNMTALHALVDARMQKGGPTPGRAIVLMMRTLFERGARGAQPDVFNCTAANRMRRETPDLFDLWQSMEAKHNRTLFELCLPECDKKSGGTRETRARAQQRL